ncbi:MAG TPA: glycosyltransferase family 2 protein [Salinimicrobium sp.]|nr:glycosyltransferase family 2 protein [Salinimicrobium sp.]
MKIYIVIPAHNEEALLAQTLQSLANQTLLPEKVVLVDDHSTDKTAAIAWEFASKNNIFSVVKTNSSEAHLPGSKVINAFYRGFETLDDSFDLLCKFDADLIFPDNYLEEIALAFQQNPELGMAGGFCYIQKNGEFILENLTNKDHIRGALKTYRKECFFQIGKIKPAMGWDTLDELLAQFHGWEIKTLENLKVKHLKPTGATYNKAARYKQGEAFYRMRYGFRLTFIASLKLALRKKNIALTKDYLVGFYKAKKENLSFLVSEKEGEFIRNLRWKNIRKKIF